MGSFSLWIIFVLFDLNFFLSSLLVSCMDTLVSGPTASSASSECSHSHGLYSLLYSSISPPEFILPLAWVLGQPPTYVHEEPTEDLTLRRQPSTNGGWFEQTFLPFFPQADNNSDKHCTCCQRVPVALSLSHPQQCWLRGVYSPGLSLLFHLTSWLTFCINYLNTNLFLRLCFQWCPDYNSLKAQI